VCIHAVLRSPPVWGCCRGAAMIGIDIVIKQFAVGLAVSVLIDATVVRLLLVPAVMYLLGTTSW
jgi:RND superfamily putative drug exporter